MDQYLSGYIYLYNLCILCTEFKVRKALFLERFYQRAIFFPVENPCSSRLCIRNKQLVNVKSHLIPIAICKKKARTYGKVP